MGAGGVVAAASYILAPSDPDTSVAQIAAAVAVGEETSLPVLRLHHQQIPVHEAAAAAAGSFAAADIAVAAAPHPET